MNEDIRWEQRFSNYVKALGKLKQSVEYMQLQQQATDLVLNELVKEGLIQRFEYTHELAWNVMKDYAQYQGNTGVGGSRDATKEAFQLQLISNGHVWMDMIGSRNKTTHTYHEATANEIYSKILSDYLPAFVAFREVMEGKITSAQNQLF